ncbi:tetratricopeptide repeat protein [Oceanibaculum indicum]|uniref:Methyltransferase n=1 Tax=Oceanibaculum indicum P24 TaxID=1207063 RepID=K2ITM4_9PROT|nr:tetratricopeptide repeat protein [Oceanibaculum indicum]EKE73611.1 methyltransferase [Oceanibaculum indicum P24]
MSSASSLPSALPPFLAALPDSESSAPLYAGDGIAAALTLREAGAPGAALDRLAAVLRHWPAETEPCLLAGEILLELGRSTEAAGIITRALALAPGDTRIRLAHAEALARSGRPATAITAYEALLRLRPGHAGALLGLARLQAVTGEQERAADTYRELCRIDPRDPVAAQELGALLIGLDALPEAVEALQRALRLDPSNAESHAHLGRAWMLLGEREKARASLARALELDSADRLGVQSLLEALDAPSDSLPPSYVRHLFDQYAEAFDKALLEVLDYQGPRLLRRALDRLIPTESHGHLAMLDIGCGTGLTGRELRPFARHLAGIDLAPRMIEQAARTGVYDALAVADAVAALRDGVEECTRWDVVVAGDVLVYLGDLAPLMEALAAALEPGGLFLATAEALPEGSDGPFQLKPTRRFGHAEGYIARLAAERGLSVVLAEQAVLRLEKRQPVQGFVIALKRSA